MAEEGGAFGCALMAGVGAGHWKNLDEACEQAIEVAAAYRARCSRRSGLQGRLREVEEAVSGAEDAQGLNFKLPA